MFDNRIRDHKRHLDRLIVLKKASRQHPDIC
jgi:hypothetical protein